MPRAASNGIEIEYETFGEPEDPALLLVSGLGGQLIGWETELCHGFVDRGFFVIRFDNRDAGLSTVFSGHYDVVAAVLDAAAGEPIEAPYLLDDMARDAWGLLDALGIEQANLMGLSMGGMIVQAMAILELDRALSLTSIMSTTGDHDVGRPTTEILMSMVTPAPAEREAIIAHEIESSRLIWSPEAFDEERARERATRHYDRAYNPEGINRQTMAIIASGSRSEALRRLDIPALVIHGDADPLVDVSGGERTAECLAGSELLIIEGMAHDIPPIYWAGIIEAVTALAARAAGAR